MSTDVLLGAAPTIPYYTSVANLSIILRHLIRLDSHGIPCRVHLLSSHLLLCSLLPKAGAPLASPRKPWILLWVAFTGINHLQITQGCNLPCTTSAVCRRHRL